MKHVLPLLASLIFAFSAQAQSPVLWHHSTGWNPGDSINYTSAVNPGTVTPGAEGANVTWDFSNLEAEGPYIYNLVAEDPDDTFFGGSFPSATYARQPVFGTYYFYDVNATSLDYLGFASFFEEMVLNDPLTLFYFPMQYGDFHTDTAGAVYNSNGNQYAYITNNTIEADSYGTLILPDATYTDAVRLKVSTNENFNGTTVSDARGVFTDTWYWYSPSVRGTLLFIAHETMVDNGVITEEARVNYRASTITGINAPESLSDMRIYPNPTNGQLNIELDLETGSEVTAALTDLSGKRVMNIHNGFQGAGTQTFKPDLSDLSAGFYLLSMNIDGQQLVKKIALN